MGRSVSILSGERDLHWKMVGYPLHTKERITMSALRNTHRLVAFCAVSLALSGCNRNENGRNGRDAPSPAAKEPAAAEPAKTPGTLKDSDISGALKTALARDPGIDEQDIDVKVTNGIAELTGSVDDMLSKRRAFLLAETVRGVRSVSDRVKVEVKERPDAEIQRDVKHALLMNAATDSFEIEPRSEGGVVTLTGRVQSFQERQLAERMAEGVRGVREVKNAITIDFGRPRVDAEIARDIESAFRWDRLLDAGEIRVEVKGGKAILSGRVGSAAERRRAYHTAWVNGVTDVDHSALKVDAAASRNELRTSKDMTRPDAEIVRAIEDAAVLDPRVETDGLDVKVTGGVATLTGDVPSVQAKMAAESLARNTVGVSSVKNELAVVPQKPVGDAAITDALRTALLYDPFTQSYQIGVKVNDGTVTLTGTVDNAFERAQATHVAAGINGVKRVDNRLDVEEPDVSYVYSFYLEPYAPLVDTWYYVPVRPARPDAEVMREIQEELTWSPFVDGDEVNVNVVSGKATLTGTVDSHAEREAATENAFEGGALVVDNRLEVKP